MAPMNPIPTVRMPHRPILFLAAAALAACGDGTGSGAVRLEPGIAVVAGADARDTARTTLAQALVVRVAGSDGKPASGIVVRFSGGPARGADGEVRSVWVSHPAAYGGGSEISVDTTDAEGSAAARIRLGETAGPVSVVVTAPALGYADTASFTVLPGSAARVVATPEDTAVYVGGTLPLRAVVTDRFGNERPDPVTFTASERAVVEGDRVRAAAVGRAFVVAEGGPARDTAWLTVVPRWTVAAADAGGIVTFGLDGTGFRRLVAERGVEYLSWSPAGDHVVFGADNRIFTADLQGNRRLLAGPGVNQFHGVYSPRYTRAGDWVYFNSLEEYFDWRTQLIWRVRPDGTGMQRVTPVGRTYEYPGERMPYPSPDGTRLALYAYDHIRIRTVGDSLLAPLQVRGTEPRWSPNAELIAFTDRGSGLGDGAIKVMRSDGTNVRTLAPGHRFAGFDWSPDGKWLIARSVGGHLVLIDVEANEFMPLWYTRPWDVDWPALKN
jgi:hypothetical protein